MVAPEFPRPPYTWLITSVADPKALGWVPGKATRLRSSARTTANEKALGRFLLMRFSSFAGLLEPLVELQLLFGCDGRDRPTPNFPPSVILGESGSKYNVQLSAIDSDILQLSMTPS